MWVIRSDKVDHFRKKGQYIEQKEGVRFMEQFIVQNKQQEALYIVMATVLAAVGGFGWTCVVKSQCDVPGGACEGSVLDYNRGLHQCSFRTSVPLAADILYSPPTNVSSPSSSLSSLTRGLCGAGERLQWSFITNRPTCQLLRPYPNALNTEILSTSSSLQAKRPAHEHACGAWIGQGLTFAKETYLSFGDASAKKAAIEHAEATNTQAKARSYASGNMGRFESACQRVALGGTAALRAATRHAYEYLLAEAHIEAVSNEDSALHALGKLTSFYCDGPVVFGYRPYGTWTFNSLGYQAVASRGTRFEPYSLAMALQLVDESVALQANAEDANAYLNDAFDDSSIDIDTVMRAYRAGNDPSIDIDTVMRAYRAGTGRDASEDPDANMVVMMANLPEFKGFVNLTNVNPSQAKAYLKGVAATCAFSLHTLADVHGATTSFLSPFSDDRAKANLHVHAHNRRQKLPNATALGRLEIPVYTDNGPDALFEATSEHVLNASTITLSQLQPPIYSYDPQTTCLSFRRMLFPDEIDEAYFDLVVSPLLYARMNETAETARQSVLDVLRGRADVRSALSNPDLVAEGVSRTRIRIPGAPQGSWGGTTRPKSTASFAVTDGVLVMGLKQARRIWLDRQSELVYGQYDVCEGPAIMNALSTNAYIYPTYACSYYLLGMSSRPFADAMYDDESLISRFGYIIAHELGHMTLNTAYAEPGISTLLQDWPCATGSTRDEAMADAIAALAVVNSSRVSSSRFCLHVSQTWCARVPLGHGGCVGQSHPLANVRGDALCAFMTRTGV